MQVPRDINVLTDDEPDHVAGEHYIVSIGIDSYLHWPRLQNAANDARVVHDEFVRLGFQPFVAPLIDTAATSTDLRELVTDKLPRLGKNDSLVFFYGGHGHTSTSTFADGDAVKTGYLIPQDSEPAEVSKAKWLRLDSLLSDLARLEVRHLLIFIDACNSGVALGSLVRSRGAGDVGGDPLKYLRRRRSRRVISSALDDQLAMDGGPVAGHSLFTGCLLEGLRGGMANPEGVVTGSQIGLYLQRRVSTYPGSKQTPDFGAIDEDRRGELAIRIASAVPSARRTRHDGPATTPLRLQIYNEKRSIRSLAAWAPSSRLAISAVSRGALHDGSPTFELGAPKLAATQVRLYTFNAEASLAVFLSEVDLPVSQVGTISDKIGTAAQWRARGVSARDGAEVTVSGAGIHASAGIHAVNESTPSRLRLAAHGSPPDDAIWCGAPVEVDGLVVATTVSFDPNDAVLHAIAVSEWTSLTRDIAAVQGLARDLERRTLKEAQLDVHRSSLVPGIAVALRERGAPQVRVRKIEQRLHAMFRCGGALDIGLINELHRELGSNLGRLIRAVVSSEATGTDELPGAATREFMTAVARDPWSWELQIQTASLLGLQRRVVNPGESLLVGRDPECDIHIPDPQVSRHHLKIEAKTLQLVVIDLDSKHGTYIDYNRLRGGGVARGSNVISLGDSKIAVVSGMKIPKSPRTRTE